MQDKYPDECTRDKENQWKNSIRHNLSLHKKVFKRFKSHDIVLFILSQGFQHLIVFLRVRTKQSEQHEWAYMENGGWSTAELM